MAVKSITDCQVFKGFLRTCAYCWNYGYPDLGVFEGLKLPFFE